MNNRLSGFMPVFKYTLKNQISSKKYIIITIVFAMLLMGGISSIFVFLGAPDEDIIDFNISTVYVLDSTGLGVADYNGYARQMDDTDIAEISFIECDDIDKCIEQNSDDEDFILIEQSEIDDGYVVNVITADDTGFDRDVLESFGESLKEYFQLHVYEKSGLSEAALANALIQVDYTVLNFDSDEDEMKDIIEIIVFMILLMLIYTIVLLYGQKICTEVSIEKNSKLVEQLLVSVTPYGLIAGKTFAVILSSLLQFVIWVVAVIWGIFGGDAMEQMLYSDYDSKVSLVLDTIKALFGQMAFDTSAVVVSIILMILGIIIYLVLAAFAGSFVTKPEDSSNVQGLYTIPIVIFFMIDLVQLVNGEGTVTNALHFIPFTAAMVTPAAVLLGAIPLWMGIASGVITIIVAVLLMYVAARVYKALLFFAGNKLTPKAVIGLLKKK